MKMNTTPSAAAVNQVPQDSAYSRNLLTFAEYMKKKHNREVVYPNSFIRKYKLMPLSVNTVFRRDIQ